MTDSQLGFVNLVGDDGLLHYIAISNMGWEKCLMHDKTGHRRPPGNFVVYGLYGSVINNERCFFTNYLRSHSDSLGISSGHPQLTSFLGVPLVLDGKMMGMLGIANREGGYSSEQRRILKLSHQQWCRFYREKGPKRNFKREERFTAFMDNSPIIV